MKAALIAAAALILAACGSAKATDRALPESPENFVAVRTPASHLQQLSAETGAVQGVLVADLGPDFTNNGLTRSPDGRWIFATWIGRHSLRIERISTAGGPRTFIADGSQPTISPDGRYLAYITGAKDHFVAVRDLRDGRTRKWDLSALIGDRVSLGNGQLLWSGAGELVAHPERFGERVADSGERSDTSFLVHFDPAADTAILKVTRFDPGEGLVDVYSGGTADPDSVIASHLVGEKTEFDRIYISSGHRSRLVEFAGMALALDRSGTHLLYLIGHSPAALWSAELRAGGLRKPHRILKNARISGGVFW
ncbi:MAG TPA: hypothetical protein VHC49_23255 [Mycobacteriales bacterium]|nr:hypothetical protein [Mycobacteriales bacterium]